MTVAETLEEFLQTGRNYSSSAGLDLTSIAIAYLTLAWLVLVYALQCARPLALALLTWLRQRGY